MKYIEPSNSALFPARGGSYAAGNPVQGIAGSIVPPEAIEHPMREIENVLKAAGVTPSESDLAQLAQSMRIFASCIFWSDAAAADLTYVSATQFSTITADAFTVGDRLLVNGELLALVTAVGTVSPYVITVEYITVPATINKIQNQRLGGSFAPASINYVNQLLANLDIDGGTF